ncbi:MAG: tetratricopeptide repeat protein [Planctomycetaceae bacterium]
MNNLLRYLKSRWPLVTLALTAPLVLSGVLLWMTDMETSGSVTGFNLPPVLPPASTPLMGPPPFGVDSVVDLRLRIEQLHTGLSELRKATSPDPLGIGRELLQLAALESAGGNEESSTDALREVLSLHSNTEHWQVREARARIAVLSALASRTPEARQSWKAASQLHFEAMTLHMGGHYFEAIDRARKALDVRRELWGTDHVESAESLLQLARFSLEHSDEYLRAEDRAREAIEEIRTAVGPLHPLNGDGLYVLAILADDRGEFDKADRLYEDAMRIYRESVGELSREFAQALNRQGRMHNVWWKDFGAGKTLRALQIREQILDRDHPDCAESMEDLGEVAYSLLNFDRAENLLEEAIAIRTQRQGPDHPDLARPQCLLAVCQTEQGNVSAAVVNVRKALTRTETFHGAKHPLVAEQRITMAKIQERGLFDNAGSYLTSQKALEVLSDLGQQGHPRYCRAMLQQGDWPDSTCMRGSTWVIHANTPGEVSMSFELFARMPQVNPIPRVSLCSLTVFSS